MGVALALLVASSAQAQLRSGRVDRELYQSGSAAPTRAQAGGSETAQSQATRSQATQARPSAPDSAPGVRAKTHRQPVVVAASHVEGSPQSILETPAAPSGRQQVSQFQPSSPQGTRVEHSHEFAPTASYDDSHVSDGYYQEQPLTDWGFGNRGCDDLGCSDCCGGLADIAPTCATACPPGRGPLMAFWCRLSVRGETPLYWRRAAAPPALVTTSPDGTEAGIAGELGRATTSTLLGNTRLNEDLNVGVRITLAAWLDQEATYGLMFRYWNAGDQDDTYNFSSDTHSILARPFFNTTVANAFENDTQLIAFGNQLTGNINVETTSAVDGLELSVRRRLYQDRFTRVDWLSGYMHVGINEGLTISSNTNVTANNSSIAVTDRFRTENSFHGASYGLMSSRHMARWKMESLVRLGAGNLRREVSIDGSTTTTSAGQSNTVGQGLLARSSNSRSFTDDTFIIVPEVGINFAYCLRTGLDFNVGYNYMLIPKVAQASQQINDNLRVNLSDPLTGALDPGFNFDERSYWLHSLGLGLQLRF